MFKAISPFSKALKTVTELDDLFFVLERTCASNCFKAKGPKGLNSQGETDFTEKTATNNI